ncbi:predicted protein [Uncinocarpus reesii 1704]|uniref:Uncharacterized protein n=1 Tax=Uncinocarpus reesii (strain UAMH 1704) TaxID=336963 RepID=C4JXW8_UNCRE|nr:uncharacterized protein UREG_07019 [Uncinocarpus reesii 1704]EEP82154.1 predicted protein [Uncinocarpus reesii 1704]
MAEAVGLIASVVTLSKLANGVCRGLRDLHELLGELPGRLASLSNEVDDAKIVLVHLSRCLKERELRKSNANDEDDHLGADIHDEVAVHIAKLKGYLTELDSIVEEVRTTGLQSKFGSAHRVYAWKKHHGRLNEVQKQIVAAKANLHFILDTAATYKLTRVDIQLNELSHANSTQGTELKSLINNHHEALKSYITEQLSLTMSTMNDNTPRLPRLHPNVIRTRSRAAAATKDGKSQLQPSNSQQIETVRVGVQSNRTWCDRACPCQCHNSRRSQTPGIVSRFLGQLFVDYSGIPAVTPECNHQACNQARAPKVQAEFWFPANVFWSKIFQLQATYHGVTGPSLQLRTYRHVPDSAPAVNYTINGNINALKALFAQGLASPLDISDTRGYSLLRWEICRFLYDQGADADYRPKSRNDNSPRNKASDLLLQGGLGRDAVNALSRISRREDWLDEQNLPLLHQIVLGISGRDLVQELQEHPEAVNYQDAMGRTALLWAAARGDDEAVTTLLHFNADPNIMDSQHAGPVSYAADRNHTTCTRILLAAGCDPDPIIPGGYKVGSPLNCAARNATDPLLIKALLQYGANVDACGVDGRTALIHATRNDNVDFAKLLLEYNANINAISTAGQTPLTTAIVNNSHGVLSLLLERWDQYSVCPRLMGPHLLKITAQYADLETMSILLQTDHFRLKHDERYSIGDFDSLLHQRLDVDEEMKQMFDELLTLVRAQASCQSETSGSLMEKGINFEQEKHDYAEKI